MAHQGGFPFRKWDESHYRQTEAYTQAIDALYNQAIDEYSRLLSRIKVDPDKPFSFTDYPQTQATVARIMGQLSVRMQAIIDKGSKEQWLYASKKNDAFLQSILNTSEMDPTHLSQMQDHNLDALKSFQQRKVDGQDLSDRVWKYTNQFKSSIELATDVSIGEGNSAQVLSKELKQYLKYPDKLFRRVRDLRGDLHLSKNAKDFHPGQGVYRSSSQNAKRLARSEINMAYRTSEQARWNKLDFVVGYEIRLSNNHPVKDICDELVGKYPKNFVFKGWHPQCRCYAIPILMSPDEFDTDELNELTSALKGTEYNKLTSRNQVNDVPDNFKKWISENTDRASGWKSQPYFIKDNFKGGKIPGGLKLDPGIVIRNEGAAFINTLTVKEAEIRNRPTEKAVILDDDGSVLLEKTSSSVDSVSFNRNEIMLFNNKTLTHNHPLHPGTEVNFIGRIGVSFSRADIKAAINSNLKEIRVVTPTYQFSMKRPVDGWPPMGDASDMIYDMGNDLLTELEGMINNGLLTNIQANTLFAHLLWKRFSAETGAIYTKKEIISPRI